MKRIFCMVVLSCVLILSQVPALAAAAAADVDRNISLLNKWQVSASEQQILKDALNRKRSVSDSGRALGTDKAAVSEYDLSEAKKIFELQDLMLTGYSAENGIKALITDRSTVQVPVKDNKNADGIAKFSGVNDEFTGSIYNLNPNEKVPGTEELAALIGNNVKNVSDIMLAHSNRYYTTFVVIESQSGEYLIPYSTAPDKIGLTNGKVYSSKQAVDIMSAIFDEKAAIEKGNLNAGTPLRNHLPQVILWSSLFVAFLCISLLLIALHVRSKRKKANMQ